MLKATTQHAAGRRAVAMLIAGWFFVGIVGQPLEARAQSVEYPSLPADWHFRFEMFQMLLEQNGLQPVQSATEAFDAPDESVIVIIGRVSDDRFWPEARRYLNQGGHLLIASDRDCIAPQWFRTNAGPVITNRAAYKYQQHNDCLRIVDLDQTHPIMASVGTVVVNRSGWLSGLTSVHGDWEIVAQLPPLTFPTDSASRALIAVSEPNGSGRIVLAADHSLFTNGMLWHGDNAALARNIAQFLCHGGRRKILFVVDNEVRGSFLAGLPPSPELPSLNQPPGQPQVDPAELVKRLPLDQMVRLANSVVARVEDSNLLNSAVIERPRNVREAYFRRGLLVLAAMTAMVLIVRALTNSNPPSAPVSRPRSMLSPSDLNANQRDTPPGRGSAARLLVHDLFRQLTSSSDPEDWKRRITARSLTSGLSRAPNSIRETIPLLLSLAFSRRTPHLSRTHFVDVGRAVEHLRIRLGGNFQPRDGTP